MSFDPTGHYYVQRRRRFSFLDEWRAKRREVGRGAAVRMEDSPLRRARVGVLVGEDAGVPMRMIDARLLELGPRTATSTHRHAHDAILFVLEGEGVAEIGGQRYRFGRWDTLHTPSGTWHRFRNEGDGVARLLAITDAPLVRTFGLARIEEAGDRAPEADPPAPAAPRGASAYEREVAASAAAWEERRLARRHLPFGEVVLKPNPKGSKSALLVDRSVGYRTTGLSLAMFELAPGQAQSKHRHPGEAILYIVDGMGYSVIDDDRIEWRTGDAVIVNHYAWHQHFNGSTTRPCTVVRTHMWESVIETMQAAMDPVPLYEDEPAVETKVRAALGGD